ncbi:response regulator transcription factor [Chitinimonas lacunae]|uniref:Response regulator transcription factor n=1 Tax=Chitinimonas lacunae TaxID=1963018 RepID=A0ABV8MKV9_9NEIS
MARVEEYVVVVDDDPAVREALCLMLRSLKIPVESYGSAVDFLLGYCSQPCACLVLDIRLPDISGLELQRRLNQRRANIPIVFITGHGDVPLAVEAMRQGAVDFLQKPLQEHELLERVQHCIASFRAQRAERMSRETIAARVACLTPREREVFELILEGRRSKQIADLMGLSLKTVEEYRSKVLHKMHVTSTPELIREIASTRITQ